MATVMSLVPAMFISLQIGMYLRFVLIGKVGN